MDTTECATCRKLFERKKSQILLAKRHYCSIECQNVGKRKGRVVACFLCGRKVYKQIKDLIKTKNGLHFCGIRCSNEWLGANNRGSRHPNWKGGKAVYRDILNRAGCSCICRLCGESDNRLLAVHHIDQDRTNNDADNLAFLCFNCHFLVHHYIVELNNLNRLIYKHGNQ